MAVLCRWLCVTHDRWGERSACPTGNQHCIMTAVVPRAEFAADVAERIEALAGTLEMEDWCDCDTRLRALAAQIRKEGE